MNKKENGKLSAYFLWFQLITMLTNLNPDDGVPSTRRWYLDQSSQWHWNNALTFFFTDNSTTDYCSTQRNKYFQLKAFEMLQTTFILSISFTFSLTFLLLDSCKCLFSFLRQKKCNFPLNFISLFLFLEIHFKYYKRKQTCH